MKISWHGHSCFVLETSKNERIIIDPFIRDNPVSDLDVEKVKIDYILITHAHNDHFGDAIELAKNNDALVIANVEIADFLSSMNIQSHGMNIGGSYDFPFATVKMTPAIHSSSLNYEGEIMELGLAAGFVLELEGKRIYHAGDTALFSDMKLIKNIDLALLPIGDNYTMGIEDAILAMELIQAKTTIPMHYNTFPLIKQDPHKLVSKSKDQKVFIPKIGENLKL